MLVIKETPATIYHLTLSSEEFQLLKRCVEFRTSGGDPDIISKADLAPSNQLEKELCLGS